MQIISNVMVLKLMNINFFFESQKSTSLLMKINKIHFNAKNNKQEKRSSKIKEQKGLPLSKRASDRRLLNQIDNHSEQGAAQIKIKMGLIKCESPKSPRKLVYLRRILMTSIFRYHRKHRLQCVLNPETPLNTLEPLLCHCMRSLVARPIDKVENTGMEYFRQFLNRLD